MRRESARRRGGNGSVSAVAGVLAGSTRPLGILPLRTLDPFATDLGVPLDSDGAVAVIAAGRVRREDVAEINNQVSTNYRLLFSVQSAILISFVIETKKEVPHG